MNQKFDQVFNKLMESPDWIITGNPKMKRMSFEDKSQNPYCFFAAGDGVAYSYGALHEVLRKHLNEISTIDDPIMKNIAYSDARIKQINWTDNSINSSKLVAGRFWNIKPTYISFWCDAPTVASSLEGVLAMLDAFKLNPQDLTWNLPDKTKYRMRYEMDDFKNYTYSEFLVRARGMIDPELNKKIAAQQQLHTLAGMKRAVGALPPPVEGPSNAAEIKHLSNLGRGD